MDSQIKDKRRIRIAVMLSAFTFQCDTCAWVDIQIFILGKSGVIVFTRYCNASAR